MVTPILSPQNVGVTASASGKNCKRSQFLPEGQSVLTARAAEKQCKGILRAAPFMPCFLKAVLSAFKRYLNGA